MRTENLVKVSFKDVLPSRKRVRYSAASLNFVEVDMHPLRLAKAMEDMSISDEEIIAEMDALTDKLLGDGKVPSLERHITFETLCMRLQKWRPSIIARVSRLSCTFDTFGGVG
ncbi:MAG: hypothetical protein UY63_C0005G0030 [Parcubacteria group bacterium GW2011_GWA2_51_10]|nr:MAG: hypothetical protein UY63_C0005G0030 [Parcubacteria group bacterium GW2011_GWA2_51_10]